MNKTKNWKKEKLIDPELMSFYVEYKTRDWLREEALKRKITAGSIIRHALKNLKKLWR